MFELSIAWKYLLPRRKRLSASIISVISTFVIALVVWLALVFFSVVEGLEKGWIDKLTALTAPIRVTPTSDYYRSFYYRIDSLAERSNYTPRTIAEKLAAEESNPYDPETDPEIPTSWPKPEKDLVKELFASIESVRLALDLEPIEFSAGDYEVAVSNLRLRLLRDHTQEPLLAQEAEQRFLTQTSYLYSFEESNQQLRKTMQQVSLKDLNNLSRALNQLKAEPEELTTQLHSLFDHITISAIKPEGSFFPLKRQLLPSHFSWQVLAVMWNGRVEKIYIPENQKKSEWLVKELLQQGMPTTAGTLSYDSTGKSLIFTLPKGAAVPLPEHIPLTVGGELMMQAELIPSSLEHATHLSDLLFSVKFPIQQTTLEETLPFQKMEFARARPIEHLNKEVSYPPFWLYYTTSEDGVITPHLPDNSLMGEGILMPKSFRDNGVLLGDRGYLSYYAPTTSSVQEQRLPVYVAGFYDPGIIPIGGKFVTVNRRLTTLLQSNQQVEAAQSNGVAVRFEDLSLTKRIKSLLSKELKNRDIDNYWKVESYQEYDFTREIVQQLRSERNLFSLISLIIILVACSNIISMLIILVNDKKTEIGVMRAMGATSKQIAAIFGLCGLVMGTIGSLIGTAAACLTLKFLPSLLNLLGKLQGFDVFNKNFYGDVLPNTLSLYALGLVLGSTVVLSLLAGVIPALKASMIAPARVLRQE